MRNAARWFGVVGLALMLMGSGPQPTLSFRIHTELTTVSAPGQAVPVTLFNPDQEIHISRFADLTENHVADVQRMPGGGVLVLFKQEGASLLDVATTNNQGRIMVVMVNGRVLYAPVIDAPLRKGRMMLPPGITDEEFTLWQKNLASARR